MKKFCRDLLFVWVIFGFILFSLPVFAGDSAYRRELAQKSKREGMGGKPLSLYRRDPGDLNARFSQFNRLIHSLSGFTLPLENWENQNSSFATWIDGWEISLSADGTAFRIEKPMRYSPDAVNEPIDVDSLEVMGRDFIARELGAVLPLNTKREKIEYLGSGYFRAGGSDESGEHRISAILSHVAIFGRSIDGQAVIGPGSKLALIFDSQRRIVGLHADWPTYSPEQKKQSPLPPTLVWEEAAKKLGMPAPELESQSRRFECGYFDSGRAGELLKPTCFIEELAPMPLPSGSRYQLPRARLHYVPAGEDLVAAQGTAKSKVRSSKPKMDSLIDRRPGQQVPAQRRQSAPAGDVNAPTPGR